MKQTVEEAAKQELISSYAIAVEGELVYQKQAMLNMFKKGADWQAKQSSWISIEEGLPEKDGYYVITDGNIIALVYFLKCFNKFARYRGYPYTFYENNGIKAYMLIPSFDETLKANKDVSQRIKEKGD